MATVKGVKLYDNILAPYPEITRVSADSMEQIFQTVSEGQADALISKTFYAGYINKTLLAYSGKGKFITEQIELNILIQEMIKLLEISISKMATLRFYLSPDLPLIRWRYQTDQADNNEPCYKCLRVTGRHSRMTRLTVQGE